MAVDQPARSGARSSVGSQSHALIRLVGAVLAEQHVEWAERRRYLGLEILARARVTAVPDTATGGEEVNSIDMIPALSA